MEEEQALQEEETALTSIQETLDRKAKELNDDGRQMQQEINEFVCVDYEDMAAKRELFSRQGKVYERAEFYQ